MNSPTIITEGTMSLTTKDVLELRRQLFYIDTGMFVSITPDDMTDLNPENNEILEAVGYLVDELYYSLYRHVRRPETQPIAPDPRIVRTINDLCFNLISHAMYQLWRALNAPTTDTAVRLVLEHCRDFDRLLLALFPDPEEDG